MLSFRSQRVIAIGEAMIELADIGDGTYRRGFAGDTFNTVWHMAQIPEHAGQVGFVTKVGTDTVSNAFVAQVREDGLDAGCIGHETARTMGLYMIELNGVERSFQYWRDSSAARHVADDPDWLTRVINGAGLVHLSGITLAILSPAARHTLLTVLAAARSQGVVVSFDPNVRPRLWSSSDETREVLAMFNTITDIALPSFDDENALWGDATPVDTLDRLRQAGVAEIVVKNGKDAVAAWTDGNVTRVETPSVEGIRDTSGAGDAFNAGYLSARLQGHGQGTAVQWGQTVSGEVIRHFGARIPKDHMPQLG